MSLAHLRLQAENSSVLKGPLRPRLRLLDGVKSAVVRLHGKCAMKSGNAREPRLRDTAIWPTPSGKTHQAWNSRELPPETSEEKSETEAPPKQCTLTTSPGWLAPTSLDLSWSSAVGFGEPSTVFRNAHSSSSPSLAILNLPGVSLAVPCWGSPSGWHSPVCRASS